MIYLCVTPGREIKTGRIMQALREGWGERAILIHGAPPDDDHPFIVWGQLYLALDIIPQAFKRRRPFWHVDNGFWNPAGDHGKGFYRFTYRSMSPVSLIKPALKRITPQLKPWSFRGSHIVLAMPGSSFGAAIGIDMASWLNSIQASIREYSDRPISIRPKKSQVELGIDLRNAHALVTHSSNVAVDAAIMGVPIFVEPTSPAAPVACIGVREIENPIRPSRGDWLESLANQQFTIDEMRNGVAYRCLAAVKEQVDGR